MGIPNIFEYAPSELTQDAFICWLSEWGKPEFKELDEGLHDTGNRFIKSMLGKHGISLKNDLEVLKVERQVEGIDVVISFEDYVILIEDKIYTKQHSDQLDRYKKILEEKFPKKKILPIYFQTGIQSDYKPVEKKGYKKYRRIDFLKILEEGVKKDTKNDIFSSFFTYLNKMDSRFQSFENKPLNDWDWEGWQGFYSLLQNHFDGNWDYVPNQSGGFMGFWWNFNLSDFCTINMHLEENKLCFKIEVNDEKKNYSNLRNKWHKKIIKASEDSELSITKPKRFGHGKTMTVAVLQGDYRVSRSNGLLDVENTIEKLKKAEDILNKAVNFVQNS